MGIVAEAAERPHVGLDLPPRDPDAAFAWGDARAEALLRALAGSEEAGAAVTRILDDTRAYVDSDRGHEWPAGSRVRNYRLGPLELRVHTSWAEDGQRREDFALTLLRFGVGNEHRYTGLLQLRVEHVSMPSGPGAYCLQRLGAEEAEWLALLRFLVAEGGVLRTE